MRKITPSGVYCNTGDTCYCFFVDGKLLYHSLDKKQILFFINEIVLDLQEQFRKKHPEHRVFIEKINEWKYVIQRVRDGNLLYGTPRQTHIVEIQETSRLVTNHQDEK